jgi:hypothetical protein
MARTISFEVCLQNGATAAYVATGILNMPESIHGVGIYSVTMMFVSFLWGYYLSKRVKIARYQLDGLVQSPA